MKIGFNGRPFVSKELRGLGRYTKNLIDQLIHLSSENEIHLFVNGKIPDEIKIQMPQIIFHEYKISPKILGDLFYLPYLIYKFEIDIFHSTINLGNPLFVKIPTIVTIHDAITHEHRSRLSFNFKSIWDFINYRIEYWILKRATKIITISESAKKEIISKLKIRESDISVCYNGAQLPIVHQHFKREDFYLYVGGLEERKNIKILIEALNASSIFLNTRLKLVIVGDLNQASRELKQLMNHTHFDLKIETNIDDFKLVELYSKAKALIMPSLKEGFGLPVVEAMKLNTPTLISSIDVFKEISGGHSFYFDPSTSKDLTQLLIAIENQKIELNQYTDDAYFFSKQFSWEKMAREIERIYKVNLGK